MSRSWTRGVTVASVVLVALVAAVVSYAHMHDLAARAGEGWRAAIIPLSVDGMLVAATLAIVERRRVHQPAGWAPWTGLLLGLVASLAANVAAARPDLVAQLVAAWPPLALAVSVETLVIVLRNTSPARVGDLPPAGDEWEPDAGDDPDWWADAPPAEPATVAELVAVRAAVEPAAPALAPAPPAVDEHRAPAGEPVGDDPGDDSAAAPAGHAGPPAPVADGDGRTPAGDGPDPDRVAALLAEGAGRRRLSKELSITEHAARELLAAHAARNGHAAEVAR